LKTKELIRRLQEADPSGEEECVIGNQDIHFVACEEAYWDGCAEVLIRDEDCKYYNIVGAKVVSKGRKIIIRPLSIESAIYNNEDLPVEYDDDYSRNKYESYVEKTRVKVKELNEELKEKYGER